MTVEKKLLDQVRDLFVIRDRQGQLDKEWYVEFHINGKRMRKYGDINQYASHKGRREAAERLRSHLIEKYQQEATRGRFSDKELLYLKLEKENDLRKWRSKTYRTHLSKLNTFFNFVGKENFNRVDVTRFFYVAIQVIKDIFLKRAKKFRPSFAFSFS